MTGHLDALEDARRIGALTDRTGVTLEVRTMRHRTAALTPALDATLEALTLGGTDDVDLLDISEISDGDDLADLVLLAVLDADLTKEADRLDASLGEVTSHGLVHVLGLDVAETDLDGVIAVGCLSFNLRDSAGASLDDRDGNDVVVLVPNLGHANLAAENHADQDMIPTLAWSWDNAYTTERTPLEDHYLHDVLPSLVFRPDYLTTLLSRHFVQPEYSPGYTQLISIHGCGRIHRDSYFTHIVYAGKVRGVAWGRQSGGEIY